MTDDWQIGDLAVYVGGHFIFSAAIVTGMGHPIEGEVYRVNFVHPPLFGFSEQGVGLGLDGCLLLYCSPHFRKAVRDTKPASAEFAAWLDNRQVKEGTN